MEEGHNYVPQFEQRGENVIHDFWNQSDDNYGAFHKADRKSENYRPSLLVVFVHGLNTSCRGAWGSFPEMLLNKAGVDVDVLSYNYPAQVWHATSIEQAALHLRTTLEKVHRHYNELFIIAHSAGGLVVKTMLVAEMGETLKLCKSHSRDYHPSERIGHRTRRIINIAVPHFGGRVVVTWLVFLAYHLFLCWWSAPLGWVVWVVSGGKLRWGYNSIIKAIRWRHPLLTKLEHDYFAMLRTFDELRLPRPISVDVLTDRTSRSAILQTCGTKKPEQVEEDTAAIERKSRFEVRTVMLRGLSCKSCVKHRSILLRGN